MSQNPTTTVNPPARPASNGNGLGIPRTILAYVDDRVNPVVVKELRQAVRSKFILALINLLLVFQLIVVTMVLLIDNTLSDYSFRLGRNMFWSLHTLLLIGCIYLVPIYVGVRFAAERSAQNVDLLYTTTIRPVSIIWGKFLSGAVLTFILFSTMAPFMVLTYMLRGIDVPTILLVMIIDYMTVLIAIATVIFMMTLGESLLSRLGLAIGCLVIFTTLLVNSLSWSGRYIEGWASFYESMWLLVLLGVTYTVMGQGLMILAATSMISPPSSNRALLPRIYMSACWVISGLLALGVSLITGDLDILLGWSVMASCMLACTVMVGACERDEPGLRVQAAIPENRLKRMVAFFFYSGSAGGILWSLVMTLLSLGVSVGIGAIAYYSPSFLGGVSGNDSITTAVGFMGYMFTYALLGGLIVRWVGRGKLRTETTLAMVLALMAVGSMGPPMLRVLVNPNSYGGSELWWYLTNPMAPFIAGGERDDVMLFGLVGMGLMLVLSVPWLMKQVRAFKPLPKPVVHATPAVEMATSEPQPEVRP